MASPLYRFISPRSGPNHALNRFNHFKGHRMRQLVMILASTLLSLSTVYAMDDQAPAQKIRPLIQISQDTAGS